MPYPATKRHAFALGSAAVSVEAIEIGEAGGGSAMTSFSSGAGASSVWRGGILS